MVKNKELAVGSIVEYNGNKYKVLADLGCPDCSVISICPKTCMHSRELPKLSPDTFDNIFGKCSFSERNDDQSVVFKEIKDDTSTPFTGGLEQADSSEADAGTDNNIQNVFPLYKDNNTVKTIVVDIPKDYEVDMETSSLVKGIINFKKKYINIGDVYNKLIDTNVVGYAENIETPDKAMEEENFNKYNFMINFANLLDIAQYYNGDWKADFEKFDIKYYIRFDTASNHFSVGRCIQTNSHYVYFKNKEDCQAVIDNPNFKEILNIIYGNKN